MRIITLALCALLLVACVTRDIEVETRSDPAIDLAGYSSYGWLASATIVDDPDGRWEPPNFDADAEVRRLIAGELEARGLDETDSQPEMLIAYAAGIDMTRVRTQFDPEFRMEVLRDVPQGALAIVFIDNTTRRAIWAGVASAYIKQDPEPDTVRKRLEYAITKMMQSLPE